MRDISYHSIPKSVADHHKRIDRLEKKPQRGGVGEWVGVQFEDVDIPGDGSLTDVLIDSDSGSTFFYASPFDNNVFSINQSDHKIYIEEFGVYEFKLGWDFTGVGTITNANAFVAVPTQQQVMQANMMGVARGSLKAQGVDIRVQSYPADEVSFPQPVYLTAAQNSGGTMQLNGQLIIQRTCETPHTGTAAVFPTSDYPAGSQLP